MSDFNLPEDAAVYVISVAAQISGMHAQTLRQYDRLGLVSPHRATGRGRRYSLHDIAMLREVQNLVNEGVNLAGIKKILALEETNRVLSDEVANLRSQLAGAPQRRDLVPYREANAFVIWRSER